MAEIATSTFDLEKEDSEGYDIAYAILARMGLVRLTPDQKTYLPNTTVSGRVPDGWRAQELLHLIRQQFTQAGLVLSRLYVTIGEDWAAFGPSVDADSTATTDADTKRVADFYLKISERLAKPKPFARAAAVADKS